MINVITTYGIGKLSFTSTMQFFSHIKDSLEILFQVLPNIYRWSVVETKPQSFTIFMFAEELSQIDTSEQCYKPSSHWYTTNGLKRTNFFQIDWNNQIENKID